MKGLNKSGDGKNRFRFNKKAERIKHVNVDVLHQTRLPDTLDTANALPETGSRGCHFQDQLESNKNLDSSGEFARFYYDIWPLVQSMPELLHHLPKVVDRLSKELQQAPTATLPSFLSLVSVLARDLQADLFPYLDALLGPLVTITGRITTAGSEKPTAHTLDPEATGKIFESFSHVLRFLWKPIVANPNCIRKYYGPLLGHSAQFVRDFAAKSFSVVLRRVPPKRLKPHWKKIFSAVVTNFSRFFSSEDQLNDLSVTALQQESSEDDKEAVATKCVPKRLQDLLNGMVLLVFHCSKGVKGCLHSFADVLLPVILDTFGFLSFENIAGISAAYAAQSSVESKKSSKAATKQSEMQDSLALIAAGGEHAVAQSWCGGFIAARALQLLFRHAHPSHMATLWTFTLALVESSTSMVQLFSEPVFSDLLFSNGVNVGHVHKSLEVSTLYMLELLVFGISHSSGRAISRMTSKEDKALLHKMVSKCFDLCDTLWSVDFSNCGIFSKQLVSRSAHLLCIVWQTAPRDRKIIARVEKSISLILSDGASVSISTLQTFVSMLSTKLLPVLPADVLEAHLIQPLIRSISLLRETSVDETERCNEWVTVLLRTLYAIYDVRSTVTASGQLKKTATTVKTENTVINPEESESNSDSYASSSSEDNDIEEEEKDVVERFPVNSSIYTLDADFAARSLVSTNSTDLEGLAIASIELLTTSLKETERDTTEELCLAASCLNWFAICRSDMFSPKSVLRKKTAELKPHLESLTNKLKAPAETSDSSNCFQFSYLLRVICQLQVSCQLFGGDKFLNSALLVLLERLNKTPCSVVLLWAAIGAVDYVALDSANTALSTLSNASLVISLSKCLATGSYWTRVSSLRIICLLSMQDANVTVSEEMTVDPKAGSEKQMKSDFDVATVCLNAASMPVSLLSEREYARTVGNLEAWIRLGLVSRTMISVACSFCLGMLDCKFKPFWEPAVLTLIAAVDHCASSEQDIVWGLILDVLVKKSYEGPPLEQPMDSIFDNPDKHILLPSLDDGIKQIPVETAVSATFLYVYEDNSKRDKMHAGDFKVELDARTDYNTAYITLWSVFRRCPKLTMQRSKIVVPIFLSFLRLQYYAYFSDELEYPDLLRLGILTNHPLIDENTTTVATTAPELPSYILKKRLEMFLQVFAAIPSPKQLYQHQLLYSLFHVLVAKPEPNFAKLALDCILAYKSADYSAFVDDFKGLMDDSKIRKQLITFNVSPDSGAIDKSVRPQVINLALRILYGKFSAKVRGGRAARDQSLSCRTAILTFLAVLPREELVTFFYFIFRGILPKANLLRAAKDDFTTTVSLAKADQRDAKIGDWFNHINSLVRTLTADEISSVVVERQVGFLNMFEHLVRVLGHAVFNHIEHFGEMLVLMISSSTAARSASAAARESDDHSDDEGGEEEDVEDDAVDDNNFKEKKYLNDVLKVRKLCILRLSELVHCFHKESGFLFLNRHGNIWTILKPLVDILPAALISGAKPPALLKLVHALCKYPETIKHIVGEEYLIVNIIKCASRKCDMETSKAVIESIGGLLDFEGGKYLLPHVELIIESFARKFAGDDINVRNDQLKLSQLHIYATGHIQLELHLLCRISEELFSVSKVEIDSNFVTNFSTLLLGMIRTYSMSKKIRVEEEWLLSVLKVYKALIGRMGDVCHHVNFISRLFGPASHSYSLFNTHTVRNLLCQIYGDLAGHRSTGGLLDNSFRAIRDLTAIDKNLMGGRDYALCMPVFQALCSKHSDSSEVSELSWSGLMGPSNCADNPRTASTCVVVLYEVLRCMHDEEQALRGAALASLKQLVEDGFSWGYSTPADVTWMDNMKSGLLPAIHFGMQHGSDNVKKGFIQLMSHVVKVVTALKEQGVEVREEELNTFHADLSVLQHLDAEQDFFENVCHMQIHRRIKAMSRVKNLFENGASIGTSSTVHVLVPIALHPLGSDEFLKKDHLQLLQEAAQLLGVLSHHLPWTQYYSIVKRVLKILDNLRTDKEKILLNALCSVLENFPFDLNVASGSDDNVEAFVASVDNDVAEESNEMELEDNEDVAEETTKDTACVVPEEHAVKKKIVDIVLKSLIPWIRVYLFKEETNPKGIKMKVVRSQVAVALAQLIKRLNPPFVSLEKKNTLFSNLVINVVSTLKGPDVTARDLARDSLARMVQTMGLEYLYVVLNELKHTLTEGYQRHVRNYTVRAVLNTVLENYAPSADAKSTLLGEVSEFDLLKPEFDKSIPLIMECVLDDLVGRTRDDKTHDGKVKSQIREQKGNKANDILEIVAKSILFRPSYALRSTENPSEVSSIHAIVIPLIDCLTQADDDEIEADFMKKSFAIEKDDMKNRIGRVSEALKSVAYGLAKNSSILPQELLLYLHATLQPFIISIIRDLKEQKRLRGKIVSNDETGSSAVDDFEFEINSRLPSYFMEDISDDEDFGVVTQASVHKKAKTDTNGVHTFRPSVWLPFESRHSKNQGKAVADRNVEQQATVQVLDGAHAPKRTGYGAKNVKKRGREKGVTSSSDPAVLAAVKFCLTLLSSSIKRNVVNGDESAEIKAMATPFLPLLGQCLSLPGASSIATLALRCLCSMLNWGLEVDAGFSRLIATKILRTIVAGGALISVDNELIQGYLKGLTSLFTLFNEHRKEKELKRQDKSVVNIYDDEGNMDTTKTASVVAELPLNMEDIRSLVSMLTVAVLEANGSYQSSTFQLVKTIIETRVVIPEIYDLVTKLTDQIVLSHRKGVRESCSSAVVSFMMNFPVGNKRLLAHLKQLVTNCSYEYETGRQSAMSVLQTIVKLFPLPVLQDVSTMIFFPMVQACVSDASAACRELAADVTLALCRRIDNETFNSFQEYAAQWMNSGASLSLPDIEARMLIKTGCLVGGITVAARPDLCKKGARIQEWVSLLASRLEQLLKICHTGQFGEDTPIMSLGEREGAGDDSGSTDWAVLYNILLLLEKMYIHIPSVTDSAVRTVSCLYSGSLGAPDQSLLLMEVIQEAMMYPHAWVRMVSSRILASYCKRRDAKKGKSGLIISSDKGEFLMKKGGLFGLGRKLCVVLNMPQVPEGLLQSATSTLVFVIAALSNTAGVIDNLVERRMRKGAQPNKKVKAASENEMLDLAQNSASDDDEEEVADSDGESDDASVDSSNSDDDKAELETDSGSNVEGHHWIMQRLRGIGVDSRGNRRLHVLQVFSKLLRDELKAEFYVNYAKVIIEVSMRARLYREGVVETEDEKSAKFVASEVLEQLESLIGSSSFIGFYGEVQRFIQHQKNSKKRLRAADAVRDPAAHAERKVLNAQRKKFAKKMKNARMAATKGGKKRKSFH